MYNRNNYSNSHINICSKLRLETSKSRETLDLYIGHVLYGIKIA